MEIDRDKAIKLIIVAIATLAALAVTSTLVQLISAVLPFAIVAGGVYVGYRWALNDSKAPTTDEMEEQARGLFSRFRKTKEAVETTVKVGSALNNLSNLGKSAEKEEKNTETIVQGEATTVKKETAPAPQPDDTDTEEEEEEDTSAQQAEQVADMKKSMESNPKGKIKFKDKDVVISKDDVVQPDISRLEEKEKEAPKVTNDVLAQIEERRRRLQQGGE